MRNRYVIFLLGLLCCVSAYGDNCSKYFDHDDYSIPTSAEGNIPGGYSIRTHLRNDGDSKHYILIGGSGVSILNWSFESYFENDIESLGNIEFIHSDISVEVENSGREEDNHKSMKLHEVNCCSDIEWRVGNDRWSPNPDQNSQGSASGDFSNFYGNHTLGTIESPQISLSQVWEKIEDNKSAMIKYNQDGYIDIEFRVVFYVNASYDRERDGNETLKGYIHTKNTKKIRIYRCEIGNMNIVDGETPLIDASKNLYALIEGRESPVTTSTEVKISKDSRVCQIINKYTQELSNSVIEGPIETTITPGQFITLGGGRAGSGGGLTAGDTFNVKLKAVTRAGSCESPSIKFLTLPKPQLKGFSESYTKKIECPTKSTLTVGMTLSEVFDNIDFCELEGNKCDLGAYGKYESVYGIEYGWRYWTNKNGYHKPITIADGNYKVTSTKEMLDYESSGNTPGLQLPTCALEPGVTYYFEQYVTLKNFGNMEITATAEAGTKTYYEVKLSKSLDSDNLKLDISRTEACMEEDLADVVFTAKYGEDENPKDYHLTNFKYHWDIDGEKDSVVDEVYLTRDFVRINKDVHYQVSLKDGCGNTTSKEMTLQVHDLPKFDATNIISENPNVSYSVEIDPETQGKENYLLVTTMKGREFELKISDSERSSYNYYYRFDGEDLELNSMPLSGYRERNNIANKNIYFYKEAKNGYKCMSKAVKVKIVVLDELSGNEFTNHNIYVCPGSTVPAIEFTKPSMLGVSNFNYEWMYSVDKLNWKPMVNANMGDGEDRHFTEQNYSGEWERTIEEGEVVYLKRYVTAKTENGTLLYVDESDSIVVTTYSRPAPTMMIDGSISIDPKCYGDTVTLSMNVNSDDLTKQMGQMKDDKCLMSYGYYDYDGNNYKEIINIKEGADYRLPVTKDYVVHSAVNFCGDTIYSKNGIQVKSYEKIDVEPTVGPCKVVGNEVTITAVKDGHTCDIRRGDTTFHSVDGVSTAKILLDSKKEYKYEVVVTNDETKCQAVLNKSISMDEIKERKLPVTIGPSGDGLKDTVCAGEELTITSTKSDNEFGAYSWSVNGNIQTNKTQESLVFTPTATGKEYLIERTCKYYDGLTYCYSVVDSITITTKEPLTAPSISLSESEICNGESVVVTTTAIGGGSNEYFLHIGNSVSEEKSPKGIFEITTNGLKQDSSFTAYVTDKNCKEEKYYKATSEVAKVIVEKDLKFTIVPTPSIITLADYTDEVTTRSVSIKCEGVDNNDKLYYKLGDSSEETEVDYNGTGFTIKLSKEIFSESSKVDLVVRRVGSNVKACESTSSFTFKLDEGFEGAPLLEVNGKQEMDVCPGDIVTFDIAQAGEMKFNGGPITDMAKTEWVLYKDNSVIDRINEAEKMTNPTFEISGFAAGTTNRYYVVFRGEDAGGTIRKISSNDFIVRCALGVNVGSVHFDEYPNQTFVEFCANTQAFIAMSSDLNATNIKSMQWKYNYGSVSDENSWIDVSEDINSSKLANTNNINVALSELVDVLRGDDGKLKSDKVYFRLVAIDNCEQESKSDNILLIRFKTNVEVPKPTVASSVLYGSDVEFPESLVFSRHWSHSDPYEYIGREGVTDLGGSLQSVPVKGLLQFGDNNIDVIRSEKARISEEVCFSDTLRYIYKIYQKLNDPKLTGPDNEYFCSNDENIKYLELNNILGGDGESYKTVWQYKQENKEQWTTIEAEENQDLFYATIDTITKGSVGGYYQRLYIQNLKQTIIVRAMLTCEGDYPGGYVSSNEIKINVYAPLKDGGIDFSSKEICYNTAIDTIKGFDAQGGSGRYSYVWQWSDENEDAAFKNVFKGNATYCPKNYQGEFNLDRTTYFRRVVTDTLCRSSITSDVKTVYVMDSFNIYPEDVEYTRVVMTTKSASLYGVTDFSGSGTGDLQYVWYNTPTHVHDRSAVGDEVLTLPLQVPDGDDSYVATYYAKALRGKCESANKLELNIYVYNQTGGDISFANQESDNESYWVCSGDNNIKVYGDNNAPNATFEWYYAVNGDFRNSKKITGSRDGRVTTPVTTPEEISLDTTNMILSPFPLRNSLGTTKSVSIYRLTWIEVDGKKNFLSSDTITVNIVPTLQSVSEALFDGDKKALAGEIFLEDNKSNYCLGDKANKIFGLITPEINDIWSEYDQHFGPWLYSLVPGAFTTHYEYQKDNGEWNKATTYDYGNQGQYAGMEDFLINTDILDGSYRVRRVMEDGCSSLNSNDVLLNLYNDKINPDTVVTYAYTPDMTNFNPNYAIKSGYEVGDSIVFRSEDGSGTFLWYLDSECTMAINEDGKPWCGMMLTDEIMTMKSGDGAKIYVKKRRGDCDAEPVAIPFEYGTTSDGGTIYIMDSIICRNGEYADIIGVVAASGEYISPVHEPMKWTYAWQYKRNASDIVEWSSIPGETSEGLSSEVVNGLSSTTAMMDSPLMIRRVATNDKGRVRYSNVLTLTRYDELKAGSLSVNGKKTKFCTYDELPYVSTTSASGGKVVSFYDVTWQYSINNGEWKNITCFDSLYVGQMTNDLDRSVNNIVSVRCLYADACDEVESERLDITLYRENPLPRIYEVGDSCGASLVCIKLYDDGIKKFRSWNSYYVDPEDTTYTALHTGFYSILDSIFVLKGKGNATYYTLNTEDWETGCVSDTLVFYVDSMPAISQEKPIAPTSICAGSDLEIIGGAISGGSGDKTYQWQSSQTGNEEDYADMADATRADFALQGKFIKAGTYFRRIVRDMCYEHVSDAVFVDVRQMVPVSPEDITFEDFKCPNGTFTAKVDALADSLFASEYWTLGEDTIHVIGKSIQMEGFLGDSMGYRFIHYVTDTAGLTCQSDSIVVYAHNKPSIVADDNVITTENYTPCNDRKVKIEGEKLGGQYSDKIKYAWYVNGGEVIGEFGADLNVTANGDMRIVRVADNGCVKVASDTLHIEGQIVYAYDYESELSMEVVSDVTDSSVVLNIQGSKLFSESYTFDGDGVMPDVSSNNILLPYKFDTYKDSVLNIYAKQSYCVKPYAIHPLRGGVISFDGGTLLCGDEDIPSIVVTELEGVNQEVSYQWQYRNERTPDFININGATNKDYTPEAIDVATTYRRIATAGAYKSISNELTVSIRPLPTVAQADINYTADELREFGLGYKAHEYYQWIPNEEIMRVYLVDSASNADRTYWQKSYDQKEWVMASKEGGDSLLVSDMTQSVYYRYIAESACGADTSDIVNLVTMSIDPITDDQIDWRKTDTLTCSNSEKTRLEFYMDNNNSVVKKDYFYSYRVESNCNVTLILSSEIERVRPDLRDKFCYRREYVAMYDENGEEHLPTDDVTLYVTRHDTTRGLSVTRAFVLKIDHLDVTYAMSVENGPDIRVGEKETIYLNQGERVRFTPIVTTNREDSELTYHWSLEEPINTNFFSKYSGRDGKEGLTSEYESPTCFYYNGGRYPVSLTVSNGHCEAIVKDTSLYIPESSVRNYKTSMSMDPEAHIEENEEMEYLEVYPTIVFHDVTVKSNTQKVHVAKVADELGRIYRNVKFVGMVQIPMDDMDSGTYFVIVDDDEMFKVVKR